MATLFSVDSKVTVTAKTTVPVAGSNADHTGKTGAVRGYVDLAAKDVVHIIDLDEPMFVHGPNDPKFDHQSGAPLQGNKVEWIEVPASCLSSETTHATAVGIK